MKRISSLIAISGLALAFTGSAHALQITVSDTGVYDTAVDNATIIDFENGIGGYDSATGSYNIVSGTTGQYAKPFDLGADNKYLTVPDGQSSGNATFELGQTANYFGLFWGSIDHYNDITFLLGGDTVANVKGDQLDDVDSTILVQGSQANLKDNRYINFFFGPQSFDAVKLNSTSYAFETDNHAFAQVPEPATLALLGLGLAGLGAARRRRA